MAELLSLIASVVGLIQVTTVLAGGGYSYVKSFKGAREETGKLCNELKAFHEVLQKLYTSPVYQQPTAHVALNEQLQKCLTELKSLQTILEPRKGKARFYDRLIWPIKQKEIAEFFSIIDRNTSLLTLALSADQHCVLLAVKSFSQNTDATVTDLVQQLKKQFRAWEVQKQQEAAAHEGEIRTKICNWLYANPVNERHIEISRRRQKQTGRWLLRHPDFITWQQGSGGVKIIWGHGIPGAGKTFLSSFVIDELEARTWKPNAKYAIAYIYFNFTEQEQQSPIHVLSSLIVQLISQIPKVPQVVKDLFRLLRPNDRPNLEQVKATLLAICDLFPRVFFVFDALDECHERNQRKDLLPIFHDLTRNGASLFLTGRPYSRDINESLRSDNVRDVELSAQEEDIKVYVEDTISGYPQANTLIRGDLRDRIITKLVDCCRGMFLVVHFHIENLCHYTTPRQVSTALEDLNISLRTDRPLDGIYDRAVEKIHNQYPSRASLANAVISWLVVAKRVLTMSELRTAVSIQENSESLPGDEDLPDPTMLIEVCAGLVTIDNESNTVRLAHYSIKEYLIDRPLTSGAEMLVATSCITYLLIGVSSVRHTSATKEFVRSYPLYEYIVLFLDSHLKACDEVSSATIYLKLLRNLPKLHLYLDACDAFVDERYSNIHNHLNPWFSGYWESVSPRSVLWPDKKRIYTHVDSPFFEACRLGYSTIVRPLLEEGYGSRTIDDCGNSAIHIAAAIGHVSIAQLLLENGYEVDYQDTPGYTPLMAAVVEKREEMVSFLLKKGAPIDARDSSGITALQIAALHGSEALVCILLGAGANPNTKDNEDHTPLWDAGLNGPDSIVSLLLAAGATPEVNSEIPELASGDPTSEEPFLASTSIVNDRYIDKITPLHFAIFSNNIGEIHDLLNRGEDISAADSKGETPLHYATRYKHSTVIQVILDAGADVFAVNLKGESPLHLAPVVGSLEKMQALLDAGMDILATNHKGETPLHKAVHCDNLEAIPLLLGAGADVLAMDNAGCTPLYWAIHYDDLEMTRLFLSAGMELLTASYDRETILEITRLNTNSSGSGLLKFLDSCARERSPYIIRQKTGGPSESRALLVMD